MLHKIKWCVTEREENSHTRKQAVGAPVEKCALTIKQQGDVL